MHTTQIKNRESVEYSVQNCIVAESNRPLCHHCLTKMSSPGTAELGKEFLHNGRDRGRELKVLSALDGPRIMPNPEGTKCLLQKRNNNGGIWDRHKCWGVTAPEAGTGRWERSWVGNSREE